MNPLSFAILSFLVAVVLAAKPRWALLGMAAGALYLPQYVSVNIAGINMFAMRFLEIAGFVRVLARREFRFSGMNEIDRLFLLFYSYLTIIFLLRSNESQAYQIGLFVDAAFCYFTFRGLIGNMDDLRWLLSAFAVLLIPYVALLFIEMHTGHTPFSILGSGAPALEDFRKGRVRCIGSFREPSLSGTLGASFFPLYIGMWFCKDRRWYAVTGIILCLAIVWLSNSGGPAAFAGICVLGWIFWIYRDRMRKTRYAGLAMLTVLALVMKAPIWYLPTKISFLTGGDAWHRSYLMDIAFRHIREWWLWGMPYSKTAHWFPYVLDSGIADVTNQFIAFGIDAGLMAIVLFILVLTRAFQNLGKKLAEVRMFSVAPSETEYLLWGLGVTLLGHIANFTAISYFDQIYAIWFLHLAAISSLTRAWEFDPVGPLWTRSLLFRPLNAWKTLY